MFICNLSFCLLKDRKQSLLKLCVQCLLYLWLRRKVVCACKQLRVKNLGAGSASISGECIASEFCTQLSFKNSWMVWQGAHNITEIDLAILWTEISGKEVLPPLLSTLLFLRYGLIWVVCVRQSFVVLHSLCEWLVSEQGNSAHQNLGNSSRMQQVVHRGKTQLVRPRRCICNTVKCP